MRISLNSHPTVYCGIILRSWSTRRRTFFSLSFPIYTFTLTLSWTLYILLVVVDSAFISSATEILLSHTHPLFDPSAPYIAIPLYMAHPFPPPVAATPITPPASPPQQVPFISLSGDDDLSEATSSSSSSSAPGGGYAPADTGMTNGFLSSESI